MALTAQQIADVRRFAGYPSVGADRPAGENNDFAYAYVAGGVWETLAHRLANMTQENEFILQTVYLDNLKSLEGAIVGASSNLDTDQAAVWTRNKNEIADRNNLFDGWRRRMCEFVGISPGPHLRKGKATISRG